MHTDIIDLYFNPMNMKHHFYYFKSLLVTLLALFLGTGVYAEEKTSTLTFTAKCNGSGTADDGAVWAVTSDGTESVYYETSGIHYGTGSAAVSYLQLATSDIDGTITKIVVNASGASKTTAKLNVTVGGNAFGSEQSLTQTATNYTFEGSDLGEIIVRLSQNSATKALYVKSIAVTYSTETPAGEKEPNNSFGDVTEDNATIGVPYTMPTFTTSSDGTKSYSSSDTDVATISNNGTITLLKAGTTTITVSTAQTATYAAGSASYILNVAKGTPELSFASESVTAYVGTDQNGPALTNPGDGDITYEISDPEIATIQSTGYIHPLKAGTATVTATTAETEAWNSATAFYTLTVEEAFSVDAVGTYELVTSIDDLKDGDQVLIANTLDNRRKVLGVKNGNNANYNATDLPTTDVSEDKNTLIISSGKSASVTAAILEKAADAWYFHTNNGYLYAASSSANQLKVSSTAGGKNRASIEISDGSATIKFLGDYDRRFLRYNNTYDLFSCYSSGQQPVQIYRKVNDVTLAISSVGYATMYYSDRSLKVPTGVTAKTYKVESGKLTESKTYSAGEIIPKDEAVVLKGAKGEYKFTATTTDAVKDADNQLKGTDEAKMTQGGNYYYALQASSKDGKHGPGFYWMDSEGINPVLNGAHKAYLALDKKFSDAQEGGAKSFYLFEETTGICNAQADGDTVKEQHYNLSGQRVGSCYKGIVIVNGKKFMKK